MLPSNNCCFKLLLLQLVVVALTNASTTNILARSEARLPMSFVSVINELPSSVSELTTACFLSSRSVTRRKQARLLRAFLGCEDSNNRASDIDEFTYLTACGTSSGIAVCQPNSDNNEIVSTAITVCGGTIVFYADPMDLCRGEGLLDELAPILECLIKQKLHPEETSADDEENDTAAAVSKPTLVIIVEYGDLDKAQAALEQVAEFYITNLCGVGNDAAGDSSSSSASSKNYRILQDIFDSVEYVSTPAQAANVLTSKTAARTSPLAVLNRLARSSSRRRFASSVPLSSSAEDIAAARVLGPLARAAVEETMQTIQSTCTSAAADGTTGAGETILVPKFGNLVDASVQQALEKMTAVSSVSNSNVRRQIESNFLTDISVELVGGGAGSSSSSSLFQEELELLEKASFDDFRKQLSKLLVSPNLKTDMESVVTKSVASFGKASQLLVAYQSSGMGSTSGMPTLVSAAKQRYRRRLTDFCSNRLLAAQASGQYKPLPRKGVTVGFHYLLPKPFGNDFRQEPWMVHATDSMVYIPKDKLTDVSPREVEQGGDWREKIVPSPVGNDMIYMQ